MPRQRFSKLVELEGRHPGLCRQVEAMFAAFIPLRAITAALQAQYGERISHHSIWTYKREFWKVEQEQLRALKAAQTALQELASEERI